MAYKTMEQEISDRLSELHEKCIDCDMREICYAGGRGVYFCTKWDDNWKSGMPRNVTVDKKKWESSEATDRKVPEPKMKIKNSGQGRLF